MKASRGDGSPGSGFGRQSVQRRAPLAQPAVVQADQRPMRRWSAHARRTCRRAWPRPSLRRVAAPGPAHLVVLTCHQRHIRRQCPGGDPPGAHHVRVHQVGPAKPGAEPAGKSGRGRPLQASQHLAVPHAVGARRQAIAGGHLQPRRSRDHHDPSRAFRCARRTEPPDSGRPCRRRLTRRRPSRIVVPERYWRGGRVGFARAANPTGSATANLADRRTALVRSRIWASVIAQRAALGVQLGHVPAGRGSFDEACPRPGRTVPASPRPMPVRARGGAGGKPGTA